ncbi:MAG: hypothetical protein AAGF90_14330, partial [Pseudomonadota bacterium]
LSRLRWASLAVCVVLSALIVVDGWRDDAPGWAYALVRLFQGFSSIWALLGFARLLVDRPSPALAYLAGAVFAYYVLHQTIIIAVGAPLTRTGTPLWAEAGLIVAATVLGCVAGHRFVVRRMGRFAFLLGGGRRGA